MLNIHLFRELEELFYSDFSDYSSHKCVYFPFVLALLITQMYALPDNWQMLRERQWSLLSS